MTQKIQTSKIMISGDKKKGYKAEANIDTMNYTGVGMTKKEALDDLASDVFSTVEYFATMLTQNIKLAQRATSKGEKS